MRKEASLDDFTSKHLFRLLFNQNTALSIKIIAFNVIEVICRIAFSVILLNLLATINNIDEDGNLRRAYIYVGVMGGLWFIGWVAKLNTLIDSSILFLRYRAQLINLVYSRLLKMKFFIVHQQETGKIINMFSSDFNKIEIKIHYLFILFVHPFLFLAVVVLLILRLGWPGIIPPIIILIGLFVQNLLGKMSVKVLKRMDKSADKRVKTIESILNRIKVIKFYTW